MTKLIGLGGKLRAGKDAVADYLEEKHGFKKMGMSDALNEALQKLGPKGPWVRLDFDITESLGDSGQAGSFVRYVELLDAVGYVEAKLHNDVREYLQGLGTEIGRDMFGQNVWTDLAEKKIEELQQAGSPVVITAIRFPNEVEMIKRLGGTTLWIERPDDQRLQGVESSGTELQSHASEHGVTRQDFERGIVNSGTLAQLYKKVDTVLRLVPTEH